MSLYFGKMMSHDACYYGTEPLPSVPKPSTSTPARAALLALSVCALTFAASTPFASASLWTRAIPAWQPTSGVAAPPGRAARATPPSLRRGAESHPDLTFTTAAFESVPAEVARVGADRVDLLGHDAVAGAEAPWGALLGLLLVPVFAMWINTKWVAYRKHLQRLPYGPDDQWTIDVPMPSPAVPGPQGWAGTLRRDAPWKAPVHPVVVVCGPSGVGKGTVLKQLLARHPRGYAFSVSHTTRGPRAGERNGREYHFVSQDTFAELARADAFAERTEFCGNRYGTSWEAIAQASRGNKCCLLDLDLQGALHLKEKIPSALLVYVAPPSWQVLEQRLRGRKSEAEAQIQARLQKAKHDVALFQEQYRGVFDAVVVNQDNAEGEAAELMHGMIYSGVDRGASQERCEAIPSVIAVAAAAGER